MIAWLLKSVVPAPLTLPTRILVYAIIFLSIVALCELDGYRRGEKQLWEYQAKEAKANVAVVTRVVTKENEADNAAVAALQSDYDDLERKYAVERLRNQSGAAALSSAAGKLAACKNNAGGGSNVQPVARMLDEVESAVLAILQSGDREITKCRQLYERDEALSKIR